MAARINSVYPWIAVDGMADAGTTDNFEVTVADTGVELHMKKKNNQGLLDSPAKWEAFFAKLEEEVKKAPTVDYKSMACIFDASSWIEDQKKRRTSGELAWPSAA